MPHLVPKKHHVLSSKRLSIFGLSLGLAAAVAVPTLHAFTVPPIDGFVRDDVGALTDTEEQELETMLEQYRAETSNEIAVLVVSTLDGEAIADVAVEVGREWGVGRGDVDNGILLLIALEDREMMIATGYGLEGAVPDLLAKQIIDNEIAPYFREANYFGGIQSGVVALQRVIADEYVPQEGSSTEESGWPVMGIFYFLFFMAPWLGAILGRTKSWWLGGILGAVGGAILWAAAAAAIAVLAIPFFTIIGLIFDFIVSKNYRNRGKTSWWAGGNWGPGGSGGGRIGGGGFGGFGGGSFGGGGSRGSW